MPKEKVSPRRVPHKGRRPKANVIGPDVLCAQPKPPKKPRKPGVKSRQRSSPGSAVCSMVSSLAVARLRTVKNILKDKASVFKTMDIFQVVLFACVMAFLGRGMKGLAYSAPAIGTFAPMLVRCRIAKWRNSLIP